MEQKSMTALVSAFARAYHAENNEVKIFNDNIAKKLLTDEEYRQISKSMSDAVAFFNPTIRPQQAINKGGCKMPALCALRMFIILVLILQRICGNLH